MNKRIILTAVATALLQQGITAQNTNDSIRLDDVVVTGTRSATTARNLPMTVNIIDRAQLTASQRTNVLPTLSELVPGLFVSQRGMMGFGVSGGAAGGITMRGLSSGTGQFLVLIDGQPQYQGVFGHSIADSYQTMMAERVEVLRGPASVLYGSNAMGGVINIITNSAPDLPRKDGVRSQFDFSVGSYGTWQLQAGNQVRKGRFSSTVAAQYSRSDNHRDRMGFEQYGAYVKLAYDISQHWNAFADLDLTHFNASHPGTVKSPLYEANQWITRGAATLAFVNRYEKTNGRISVYDNFGIHKINDGYGPYASRKIPQDELFRSKDALAGVSWYQSANLFCGNTITVGADYQHIYGRAYYTDRKTGEVVVDRNKRGIQSTHTHSNEVAAYIDVRQDFTSWLTLDAGVRFDHHSVAGNEVIPQAGLVIKPLRTAEFKATVSKGFRNPTTKDMYLYAVANHDSLRAERLWNYELSWHHRILDNKLTYGINAFILEGDNMIQAVAGRNVNTGELKNRGVEVEVSYRVLPFLSLNTNHSFLKMDEVIIGAPKYKGWYGADFRFKALTASAGVQRLTGLATSKTATTNVTLLNAMIAYQVNDYLKFWFRGENLLGYKYEINEGYPMPRGTFMTGVSVKF